MNKKQITTGSDFSGVGAFDIAINNVAKALGFEHKRVFSCDLDKYARITYEHNHGKPDYYPLDVYERNIPQDPLDIYMTSPPCQAFSIAGARLGKEDERGVLFYNSLEFIEKNKPRFFIFENVRGLTNHNNGKTFNEWLQYLGGKSINGNPVLFPGPASVPYHLYHKIINSKDHGVPQNRERIFLIGIRDDIDNTFTFPKEEPLEIKLRDLLDTEVDKKYYLSEKVVSDLIGQRTRYKIRQNKTGEKNYSKVDDKAQAKIESEITESPGVKIKSATKKGYEIATYEDSINFSDPDSDNKRGKVGKGIAQTIKTANQQGVLVGEKGNYTIRKITPAESFRLMGFPRTFESSVVSDSQAYKQAGNSIVPQVLEKILFNLLKNTI